SNISTRSTTSPSSRPSSASMIPRTCCRPPRLPWASRSESQATDDSHQPPRRRAHAKEDEGCIRIRPADGGRLHADPDPRSRLRGLALRRAVAREHANRQRNFGGAARDGAPPLDHPAGAAVRAAEGAAAAARHVDPAAAERADGPGPHAGSGEPLAAADAVADEHEADQCRRRHRRTVDDVDGTVGVRVEPGSVRLFQAVDRDREYAGRHGRWRAEWAVDQVPDQGHVPAAGAETGDAGADEDNGISLADA